MAKSGGRELGFRSNSGLTRRGFIAQAGGAVACSGLSGLRSNAAEVAPPTVVLVNESYLRRKYPADITSLLAGLNQFASRQNADLLFVGAGATPKEIKAQLLKHAPRPKRLLIFGDDYAVPRLNINWTNNAVYFFKGDRYLKYDLADDTIGPLKPIAGNWGFPRGWLSGRHAALSWGNDAAYFFRGGQYIRFDMTKNSASEPRPTAGNWRGFPTAWAAGVDAAINWGNGKVYFFKGSEYLSYDIADNKVDGNYPRSLAAYWRNWPAHWNSGVDGAVKWNNGKVYFFKGPEYLRYDIATDKVDDGYPTRIAANWPRMPDVFFSGIDLVVRSPGYDLPVDYFYGDLDGDGLSEVATSRILGSPQTMLRQLGAEPEPATPHALILNAEPREHAEANQIAATVTDRGCTFEVREQADVPALAKADVIIHHGHGNPNGWYGTAAGAYVTASTVPDLPRHPVIFAGACSTATPGAPILRAFMDKGCRSYVGAVSDAYGYTTAYHGNELTLHLVDALRAHPDWTVAELIGEARNRFVRVNRLAPLLLKLEKGEYASADHVLVHTALQMQVFGEITARFPKSRLTPTVARHPLTRQPVTLKAGDVSRVSYEIRPSDGLSTLCLRAEWDEDASANLEIEIVQNGEALHRLDWKRQRDYWTYSDTRVGGYWDAGRYRALALVPLKRRLGSNEAIVRITRTSKSIRIMPESELQVWPRRDVKQHSQLTRQTKISLLWICYNDDAEPMRKALAAIEGVQFDHYDTFGDMLAPYEFTDEPGHLLDLSRYDVILIDYLWNGSRDIARGMAAKIRDFVRQGGGLIMAGGPTSFVGESVYPGFGGQGGFGGTPVADALPVRMVGDGDAINALTRVSVVDPRHAITAGLQWSSFPSISGYNRLVPKPDAMVLARTESRDPLLVVGPYGKGRAAALAASSSRKWSAEFKKWPEYNRLWANVIRWTKG